MKGKQRHILPVCLMILFCLIGWAGAGRIHAQAAGEEEPEEYDFEETSGIFMCTLKEGQRPLRKRILTGVCGGIMGRAG